jgi:hypothetical protein
MKLEVVVVPVSASTPEEASSAAALRMEGPS